MTNPPNPTGIHRRQLLKLGLLGGVVLATAGGIATLSGGSGSAAAPGFKQLRESHLPMLRALVPVVLAGALPGTRSQQATEATLHGLDDSLHHISPAMNRQSLQLFDVLSMDVTRGPLTGIWGSWENTSTEAVQAFLQRWENSRFALLQQGHSALTTGILLVWYSLPDSWAECGYPGPPRI